MAADRYVAPLLGVDMLAAMAGNKPVAFMADGQLPLDLSEATAYMAHQANAATPEQLAVLKTWLVKMTLLHGSWVHDWLRFD